MKKVKTIAAVLMSVMMLAGTTSISANASVSKNYMNGILNVSGFNGTSIYANTAHKNYFISPKCASNSVVDITNNAYWNGANCQLYQLNYTFAQQYKLNLSINVQSKLTLQARSILFRSSAITKCPRCRLPSFRSGNLPRSHPR